MKKKEPKRESKNNALLILWNLLVSIILLPFRLIKAFFGLMKTTAEKTQEVKVKIKRDSLKPEYADSEIVHTYKGDFGSWEEKIRASDSKIGIILGARGTGKSALGIKLLENFHVKSSR